MVEISFTHKGLRRVFVVDTTDAIEVGSHRWHLTNGYVARDWKRAGAYGTIYLHRQLMGNPPGLAVDHRDRDRLNNQRSNLRVGTQALNCQNVPARGGTSAFRGVSLHTHGRWHARYGGRYVGLFDTDVEAARAAEAYRKIHAPFAEPDPALKALGEPC